MASDNRRYSMGENMARITSCLTLEEKELLRKKAGQRGLSGAAYIRDCIRHDIYKTDGGYDDGDRFITMREFSKRIHVSVPKAMDICKNGQIAFYMVDGSYRIKNTDVDEYLERVRVADEKKKEYLTPMFTIREVANKYHVAPQTVDTWIRQGKMPAFRIGNIVRIKKEDVDCMMSKYGMT